MRSIYVSLSKKWFWMEKMIGQHGMLKTDRNDLFVENELIVGNDLIMGNDALFYVWRMHGIAITHP